MSIRQTLSYHTSVKSSLFGCVKSPGLRDRKRVCIELILTLLRSLNRGRFHASQKGYFSLKCGIALCLAALAPVTSLKALEPSVKELFIPVDQAELFCRIIGKGEPLVVVHGGPGFSQDYLLQELKKLAEHHLVIFYDQRGCGESTGEINPELIQIGTFVQDLETLRDTLGFKKISLLGHSFGGFLAIQYAVSHPDAIDKLILLNPIPTSSEDYLEFVKERSRRFDTVTEKLDLIQNSKAFKENEPEAIAAFSKVLFSTYFFDAKKADQLNLKMSQRAHVNGLKIRTFFSQNYFSKPFNLQPELQRLRCKTLMIHGDFDPIPLSSVENTHKNIQNSQLIVIKNCGHFPYVEKPQELLAHLHSFLQSHPEAIVP